MINEQIENDRAEDPALDHVRLLREIVKTCEHVCKHWDRMKGPRFQIMTGMDVLMERLKNITEQAKKILEGK